MSTTVTPTSAPGEPVQDDPPAPVRLRWWVELIAVVGFYQLYSLARNTQGSNSTSADHAFRNARAVIRLEERLGLAFEEAFQRAFLQAEPLVKALNIYYGSAHFLVTIAAMVWLFVRQPARYRLWRWTLAWTTLLALVGFAFYPLLPPRLLPVEERAQAIVAQQPPAERDARSREQATRDAQVEVRSGRYRSPTHDYEDTLGTIGGLWNFESGAIAKLSNQYAAMPSLHFAWSVWCAMAFVPGLRRRWAKALAIAHPVITGVAIVATANHYVIDAVAGAVTLAAGLGLAVATLRARTRFVT